MSGGMGLENDSLFFVTGMGEAELGGVQRLAVKPKSFSSLPCVFPARP